MRNQTPLSTIARWYNRRYQLEEEQSFGRPLRESVHRLNLLTKQPPPLRVLDVGSGQGYFVHALCGAGMVGVGIDIAFQGVKVAYGVAPGGYFVVADGHRLPFKKDSYDAVTFWGTLEHHADMSATLAECRRVCKPGGQVIIRVPNRRFWVYTVADWLGLKAGTEQQEIVEYMLTQSEWQELFENHGLEIQKVQADSWFLHASFRDAKGSKAKFKLLLRKISIGIAPLRYTYVLDFLCRLQV